MGLPSSPTSPLSPWPEMSLFTRLMSPTAHKVLTLITCAALALYFSLPPSHNHLTLAYPRRPLAPSPAPPPTAPTSPPPRAVVGRGLSLTDYLDARFARAPELAETMAAMPDGSRLGPHVWITMADGKWARSGARALDVFVARLNGERRERYGDRMRETVLVTLCLDGECIEECENSGMYCYEGYTYNRPPLVSRTQVLKCVRRCLPHC